MTTDTFVKRLAPLYTQAGRIAAIYLNRMDLIDRLKNGDRLYLLRWSPGMAAGSQKLTGTNKLEQVEKILKAAKVSYRRGNDAPRGGREGTYIELTKKGREQLRPVNFKRIVGR